MQIIFGTESANELRQRYTVLELEEMTIPETDEQPSKTVVAYCVVPAEKISLEELPIIDNWVKLHEDFLNGYKTQQYDYCTQCIEHLMGKFGGELDTFYEEILRRINLELNKNSSAV